MPIKFTDDDFNDSFEEEKVVGKKMQLTKT